MGLDEPSEDEKELSVIDLMTYHERPPVITHPSPDNIIHYVEDDDEAQGKTLTKRKRKEKIEKLALGLFGIPAGSPGGHQGFRKRIKYEQQDKEVAEKFFGAESNIETEESRPPVNISRLHKRKPINIPSKTESEDYFSFLYSEDGRLRRRRIPKLGANMNTEQRELNKLSKALKLSGHIKQSNIVRDLALGNFVKTAGSADIALKAVFDGLKAFVENISKNKKIKIWKQQSENWWTNEATVNALIRYYQDAYGSTDDDDKGEKESWAEFYDRILGKLNEAIQYASAGENEVKLAGPGHPGGDWNGTLAGVRTEFVENRPLFPSFIDTDGKALWSFFLKQHEKNKLSYGQTDLVLGGTKYIEGGDPVVRYKFDWYGKQGSDQGYWAFSKLDGEVWVQLCMGDKCKENATAMSAAKALGLTSWEKSASFLESNSLRKFAKPEDKPVATWVTTDQDGGNKKATDVPVDQSGDPTVKRPKRSTRSTKKYTGEKNMLGTNMGDVLKTQQDGLAFRQWANDKYGAARIASHLKGEGFGDTKLDTGSNASHTNKHIASIWRAVGHKYTEEKNIKAPTGGLLGSSDKGLDVDTSGGGGARESGGGGARESGGQAKTAPTDGILTAYLMAPADTTKYANRENLKVSTITFPLVKDDKTKKVTHLDYFLTRAKAQTIKAYEADLAADKTGAIEKDLSYSAYAAEQEAAKVLEDAKDDEKDKKETGVSQGNSKEYFLVPPHGEGGNFARNNEVGTLWITKADPTKIFYIGMDGDKKALFPISRRGSNAGLEGVEGASEWLDQLSAKEIASAVNEAGPRAGKLLKPVLQAHNKLEDYTSGNRFLRPDKLGRSRWSKKKEEALGVWQKAYKPTPQ